MNIVITGCSKGIGLELVKIWSKNHMVYGISRNREKLESLNESLSDPTNFKFLSKDIVNLNQRDINDFIKHSKIDILVNNAGLLINKPFSETKYDDYRKLMDVNFWGAFNLSQLLVKKLSNAKGQIINISSMGGVNYTSKFPGLSLYSSSKAALSVFTECLSVELQSEQIKVNSLALGAVETEMLNSAFPGYVAETKAHEMASFIVEFAHSSLNIINGQVIRVSKSNP
jgi:short-subunit dehydrogenase